MTVSNHPSGSGATPLGDAALDGVVGGTATTGGVAAPNGGGDSEDATKKLPGKRTPPTIILKRG